MLLGAELQITNMFGNTFLHSFDKDPCLPAALLCSMRQSSCRFRRSLKTLFILTIPFFLSRYGIKNVMMIRSWRTSWRFALFAYGDPTPFGTVLLVLSMIVYGCVFDFFNISGSVFVEKEVSPAIRASAQGMFLMMTNGFGCILGGIVSGKVVEMYTQNGITDWQTVWLIFAGYSVVLAFAFMAMFKYKHVVSRQAHRQLATNYAKKNGLPEGDPFFYFLLQHITVQPFHAIRIGFAINTLQLRRDPATNSPLFSARK